MSEPRTSVAPSGAPRGTPVVARTWHGAVPAARAEAYLDYLQRTGVADARGTVGNRGVLILRRTEGDIAHFQFLSFWDSERSIAAFAGADIARARYYPEDRDYLIELEPGVTHTQAWIEA
jgi:heme-degrading monooxygenase HmoA